MHLKQNRKQVYSYRYFICNFLLCVCMSKFFHTKKIQALLIYTQDWIVIYNIIIACNTCSTLINIYLLKYVKKCSFSIQLIMFSTTFISTSFKIIYIHLQLLLWCFFAFYQIIAYIISMLFPFHPN